MVTWQFNFLIVLYESVLMKQIFQNSENNQTNKAPLLNMLAILPTPDRDLT